MSFLEKSRLVQLIGIGKRYGTGPTAFDALLTWT